MPAFLFDAPAEWTVGLAADGRSALTSDQCVIAEERWFLRGNLELPVAGGGDPLVFGIWLEVSEGTFERASELWGDAHRVREPPYPGWLANAVPGYAPTTIGRLARLRHRPPGLRPLVVVHQDEHPLAIDQREGVSAERAAELAELARAAAPR